MHQIELSFVGSGVSLTSLAIELFSAGPVSHVDAVEPLTGLLWGARYDKVGGKPRGFYGRPASYIEHEQTRVVIGIPCTADQSSKFWAATHRAEGEGYDWQGIVGFGSVAGTLHRRGRVFCSEAQYDHLEAAGLIAPRLFVRAWRITPMALLTSLADRLSTKVLLLKGLQGIYADRP
jgi:hypothetical protein